MQFATSLLRPDASAATLQKIFRFGLVVASSYQFAGARITLNGAFLKAEELHKC
jgi:hypothetical protein